MQYPSEGKTQINPSASSINSPISFENQIDPEDSLERNKPKNAQHVLWPAIMVCIPMILLCTALLVLVFAYEIKPRPNIFGDSLTQYEYSRAKYLLVNFSDTKIVFLASFLSTIAPLLAGCVMTIASIMLLGRSKGGQYPGQPLMATDPDQKWLLAGLIAASYQQLFGSWRYLFHKPSSRAHATIAYAAALLVLTVLMSVSVTIADAALHMLTQTVSFTLYSEPAAPTVEHGYGLNALCSNFSRVEQNYGFPCTTMANTDFVDPNAFSEQVESQKLSHNTSDQSEIRFSSTTGEGEPKVAYVIPKSTTIDSSLDYQAGTIGASAKCSLIPASTCNITRWGPYNKAYTSFNCSSNFWGSLGLAENVSSVNALRKPSRYLPLLALKPQSNIQYSFFTDRNLETIYNPAGLNDSALPDPNLRPVPDAELPSTLYMAFAWRATWTLFAGSSKNEMIAANQTGTYPGIYYLDYFMSCQIGIHDVEYIWSDGDVQSVTAKPITNGTVLDMWQGTTAYRPSINGGGTVLQDINAQAAVAGSTIEAYETRFGELLSQQVVATIGGYTSPRTVTKQQNRQTLLLAKVPKAALGSLVACSLLYPVLGIFLLYKAHRSQRHLRHHVADVQPKQSMISATRAPDPYQYQSQLPSSNDTGSQEYDRDQPVKTGDRNSTAGFRFMLWGNAGVGPNFNHLQPGKSTAGSAGQDL